MNEFKLKAPYEPTGRPATGDCRACERVQGRQSMPDFTRGLRVLKDFYDGKRFSNYRSRHLSSPAQDVSGPAIRRVQGDVPDNAVEYFVSYYDYYQPEAYVLSSDTYIAMILLSMKRLIS